MIEHFFKHLKKVLLLQEVLPGIQMELPSEHSLEFNIQVKILVISAPIKSKQSYTSPEDRILYGSLPRNTSHN